MATAEQNAWRGICPRHLTRMVRVQHSKRLGPPLPEPVMGARRGWYCGSCGIAYTVQETVVVEVALAVAGWRLWELLEGLGGAGLEGAADRR